LGTTTGSGFAAELAQNAFRAFLTDLTAYSAASRIMQQAVPAQLGAADTATYPVRNGARKILPWVGESDAIPVDPMAFTQVVVGPRRKVASLLAWSHEVDRRTDAAAIFALMLREDFGASLDTAMFSDTAASSSAHAGLLDGVTPLTSSTASGRVAIEEDLGELGAAVATGGNGNVVYVMAPERLARLRVLAPELASALDIAPSAAIAATHVIAVEPQALLVAVDSEPDVSASKEAALHMSNTPLPIVDGATADPVRSLWQTASIALRCTADLAWEKRRSNAVAFIDSAWWGA
jgi:hypothetical protein